MSHDALQAAFDLDGAFNEISLGLLRGTDPNDIIRRLDSLLADYGGVGAYARYYLAYHYKEVGQADRADQGGRGDPLNRKDQ